MEDRNAIAARIASLKEELARVEGRPTEVYSRIVGYYRSVRNWNAGKREEFGRRLNYAMPEAAPRQAEAAPRQAEAAPRQAEPAPHREPYAPSEALGRAARSGMLVFTRKACPNCPPVAEFVERERLPAVFVDVDAEEGLALARRHGVMATPTVLGLDADGRESFRAHGLSELKLRLAGVGAAV